MLAARQCSFSRAALISNGCVRAGVRNEGPDLQDATCLRVCPWIVAAAAAAAATD